MSKRRFITVEEAISLLPEGDEIHTFCECGVLVGADWSRNEIIQRFRECENIEIAGDMARSMGHGLAVYKKDCKWQSDILFVETDEDRLNAFDPIEEGK